MKEGLDPKTQLCTDDFAGHLARNANLSLKAIMGIASYARLADMLGKKDVADRYRKIADKEIAYYLPRMNRFGLPLDSRKNYTKNDWILWTATLADDQTTFEKFVDPLYRFALEAPTRVPLNDFYDSTTGIRENFKARSVVGGFYMKLLAEQWGGKGH